MKKQLLLVLLLCCSLLNMGCGQQAEEQSVAAPVVQEQGEPKTETTLIILYAYDTAEDTTYTTVAEVATADFGLEAVVQAYDLNVIQGVYGKQIVMNEIKEIPPTDETAKDGKVYIDFDSESVNQLGLGSGSEGQFFGDLARSIDENLGYVDEIYYTMDGGKDFTTGHLWFAADQPFWYGSQQPVEE